MRVTAFLMVCVAGCGDPQADVSKSLAASPALTAVETANASPFPSTSASAPLTDASSLPAVSASAAIEEPPPPCPPEMALQGKRCIDRYEAHLVIVTDAGEVPHPHSERPPFGAKYMAKSSAGMFPQAYISRVESKGACVAAGKRLCTKREWQGACRGEGGSRYPYAHVGKRGTCNSGKIHLLTQMFPKPPGGMKYDEHFNAPALNLEPGFLAKSGEYAGCHNELGTYDMVGNLHEWVSDSVTEELATEMEESDVERQWQPWREGNGIFMGGFYSTTGEHGPGCLFTTIAHEPTYHDYSTGFRCCKDAVFPPKPVGSGAPSASAPPRKVPSARPVASAPPSSSTPR